MNKICTTIPELSEAFSTFNFKLFALDTETNDSLRYDVLQMTVITLYDGVNGIYIECNPATIEYVKSYFKSFVNNPTNVVICHNIVFDMKVLHKYGINLRNCEWFDTLVAVHLIDENTNDKRLKILAQQYLNADVVLYEDLKGVKNSKNMQFVTYSINDAIYTYELCKLFAPQLQAQGLEQLFRTIEMPFQRPLLDIELNGMLIDIPRLESISKDLILQLNDIETQIYELLNIKYAVQFDLYNGMSLVSDVNLASTQDLAHILFDTLKLECTERSEKTGKPSVGKFTLEHLKGSHPVVDLLIKHKILSKLLSSFSYDAIHEYIDSDGRIRSNYRDTGTVTGRLSCNNMNLQQLPKDKKEVGVSIREVFIAGPGRKLITADYSGQELRILAEVSQDDSMISAFKEGRDFHQESADKFNVSRSQAKTINFGIAYGKGAFGFSKDFNITETEAQKILDDYFNAFPKIKLAIDSTKKELDKQDYVTNLFGRRRRMSKVTMDKWTGHLKKDYRQAFNFKIQGTAADMIRLASIKVYQLIQQNPIWGLQLEATIHDELVMSIKEEYVDIATPKIKECFESVVQYNIPMIADVKYADCYAKAK